MDRMNDTHIPTLVCKSPRLAEEIQVDQRADDYRTRQAI
jgi:hypothetical protein